LRQLCRAPDGKPIEGGRLGGRRISDYLELTGPPGHEMGGICSKANGDATLITGTLD
jgi:carbon-monoxide dehydrogenase large subunit